MIIASCFIVFHLSQTIEQLVYMLLCIFKPHLKFQSNSARDGTQPGPPFSKSERLFRK